MSDFVFHEEYFTDIPESERTKFLTHIVEYGLYGIEPNLSGFELSFWNTIARRIDQDKTNYDSTCLKRRINAINVRIKNGSATENDYKNLESFNRKLNELNEVKREIRKLNEVKRNGNELNEVKPQHCDYEFKSEFKSEYEYEYKQNESETNCGAIIDNFSPSTKYSKIIFDLFEDAGLPCCKENEISFLQTDFANAMRFIHNNADFKNMHSDEIIGAVKNYITVYQDEKCYLKNKWNFYSLVKSKPFYNLLPSNFDIKNFLKFGIDDVEIVDKSGASENQSEEEKRSYRTCPKCGEDKLWFMAKHNLWMCDGCFEQFDKEAIK